jgi:hypothetical protein
MNPQDRQAIDELFSKLAETEARAGRIDADADAYIRQRIGRQPAAPYLMAQTIVVQNAALEQARQRIADLEEQLGERGDDYGAAPERFGNEAPYAGQRPGSVPAAGPRPLGGAPLGGQPQQSTGGGFLAGAAQTAMGVAGGLLLGNALGGLFGGGSAQAAEADKTAAAPEAQPAPPAAEPAPEPTADGDGEGIFGGFFDSIFGDGGGDGGGE